MKEAAASIAIVMINWNAWQMTLKAIGTLRESLNQDFQVYIVDNASTDGSFERLQSSGSNVTLLASGRNAGWAGGNNVGIRHALEAPHDFILLLNNDATLAPRAIDVFLEAHRAVVEVGAPLAPVIGAVERSSNGGYGFVQGLIDPDTGIPRWNHRMRAEMDGAPEIYPTAYVHGACFFAHRSVYEHVGLFDEDFFLYFDETDWCIRAARAGHPLLVARDAIVHHDGGASTGSVLKTYFMTRNRLLFAEKHCTPEQRAGLIRQHNANARRYAAAEPALAAAFRQATLDFKARRFGDCPDEVRALRR